MSTHPLGDSDWLAIAPSSALRLVCVSPTSVAPAQIPHLTLATVSQAGRTAARAGWDGREVAACVFVLMATVAAYLYLTG